MNIYKIGSKKKVFNVVIVALTMLIFVVDLTSLAEGTYGICTSSNVNYRTGSDTTYNKIGQLQTNDKVTILETKNNWYKINYNGQVGWVCSDYIKTSQNSSSVGFINASNVNLRSKANTNCSVIACLDKNTSVGIISKSNGWYNVNVNGNVGWVLATYVTVGNVQEPVVATTAKMDYVYVISQQGINLREYPNISSNKKTSLAFGTKLKVVKEVNDEWLQVQTSDGNEGYVYQQYVNNQLVAGENATTNVVVYSGSQASTTQNSQNNSIITYAKKFLGTHYVWGGDSLTSGVDCSGFTKQVMAKFDVSIPRTAKGQATVGSFVNRDSLKAGDLVFFDTLKKGYISHVGMYIGNGLFIHASSSRKHNGVVITALSEYDHVYKTARRVL